MLYETFARADDKRMLRITKVKKCVQLTSDFIYKGGLSFETVDIRT